MSQGIVMQDFIMTAHVRAAEQSGIYIDYPGTVHAQLAQIYRLQVVTLGNELINNLFLGILW